MYTPSSAPNLECTFYSNCAILSRKNTAQLSSAQYPMKAISNQNMITGWKHLFFGYKVNKEIVTKM
jgi:hypothetical protein